MLPFTVKVHHKSYKVGVKWKCSFFTIKLYCYYSILLPIISHVRGNHARCNMLCTILIYFIHQRHFKSLLPFSSPL